MSKHFEPVAIVGMSCLFPGARDKDAFWDNIINGRDAITELPDDQWRKRFHQHWEEGPLELHCRRAGFIEPEIAFDPVAFGVMPAEAEGAEPDQLLSLKLVDDALKDAGYSDARLPPHHTSVVIGRGAYIGSGMSNGAHYVRVVEEILASVQTLIPDLPKEQIIALKEAYRSQLRPYGPVNAIGLVPNLAASRIANRFDFDGVAYTVDAACTSTLIALDTAIRELHEGRSEMAIAGGIHLANDLGFMSIFHALGAISRTKQIRPFHRQADGLLMGEGIGMFILKRLDDARRDDDRIYAVIRGIGTSSDGTGASMMQPRSDGQLKALERAWARTPLDPARLGLIEAHGTGTPAGDSAELTTLSRFFGTRSSNPVGLGSVKSMIGHAMPAAGAAALVKTAMALHQRKLPPTLHCDDPNPLAVEFGFRPITAAESWDSDKDRVAGLNAFGFGGINAHLILEEYRPAEEPGTAYTTTQPEPFPSFALFTSDNTERLIERLDSNQQGGTGTARLAVQDPSPERFELAKKIVAAGKRWRGKRGIWFTPSGQTARGGKVVFMYPGLEGRLPVSVENLEHHFGASEKKGLSQTPQKDRRLTESVSHYRAAQDLSQWLEDLGVYPDAFAGHSIGEWTGMVMAGICDSGEAETLIASLDDRSIEIPDVVYLAAGCSSDTALSAAEGLDGIQLSHDNCPHQIILCGPAQGIGTAMSRLRRQGVICEELPFRSGHHTSHFTAAAKKHAAEFLKSTIRAPQSPLWSATKLSPYPDDRDGIGELFESHLTHPVRFRELIQRLYEEGFRTFVQVGTGRLQAFVEDSLSTMDCTAVSCLDSGRSDSEQFARCAVELWCEGYPVDLSRIGHRPPAKPRLSKPIMIDVTDPLIPMDLSGLRDQLNLSATPSLARTTGGHPVLDELARLQSTINHSAHEIADAWQAHGPARSVKAVTPPQTAGEKVLEFTERFDMLSFPEVIDHCLCEQPADWPHMEDRFPVIPMTTSIVLMMEYAERAMPGKVAVDIQRIRANRWIVVVPATEAKVRLASDGKDRVSVSIGEFISADVLMATEFPNPPPPRSFVAEPDNSPPMTGEAFYGERWAFHGPSFQGVADIPAIGANGLEGMLRVPPAKGALLDNIGQLIGWWGIAHADTNKTFFPMRVKRIRVFSQLPPVGETVTCRVWKRQLAESSLSADAELVKDGKVIVSIDDWHDHRFESGLAMWRVFQWPEQYAYADKTEQGFCIATETWRTAASRTIFARRFLDQAELKAFVDKKPADQRDWLLGRIAAKDAARHFLWERGTSSLYPIEIRISQRQDGQPVAECPGGLRLNLSIAHKSRVGVAMVDDTESVGVDVELIESRGKSFESTAFTKQDLAQLPSMDRDEWITRFWTAKEAAGKAYGNGLDFNPRSLRIDAVDGERVRVNGLWVSTCRRDNLIFGWVKCASDFGVVEKQV